MRLEDYGEPKILTEVYGLYDRGEFDAVPEDHFTDVLNLDYDIKEWKTRPGLSPAFNLGYGNGSGAIRRFTAFNDPFLGVIVLILDNAGNFYTWSLRTGDFAETPRFTVANAIDFSALKILGKVFISCHDGNFGLAGVNLKVFIPGSDPTKDEFRDAAGLAPITPPASPMVAVDGAVSTLVNAGVYQIAISYITTTGFVTQPGPKINTVFTPITYTSPGGKQIILNNIPLGPAGTQKRQILITRSNQLRYFFLGSAFGGIINDNTTTTATLDFNDITQLVQDASYLFNLLETIPSSLVIDFYSNRLFTGGENANPSLVRGSRALDLESFDAINGIMIVNKDDGFTIRNFLNMRSGLYIWKNLGVFLFRDNGQEPASWGNPYLVCQTTNTGVHGIAEFYDMNNIKLSRDWTLLASVDGIVLFDGVVRKPPITDKINNTWMTINPNQFQKVSLVVDEIHHKIYCAIPANYELECDTLLVADYNSCSGKIPEAYKIKWSIWKLNPTNSTYTRPTEIGIFGVPPEIVPTLKIGTIDNGGKVWKLDPNYWSDDGTDIETYMKSGLLSFEPGYVNIFAASRLRIRGSGILTGSIAGEDEANPTTIPSIQLAPITTRFVIYTSTGVLDGSNTVFKLPITRNVGDFLAFFQNGLLLIEGIDFTISGKTVTMTKSPKFGDTLIFVRSNPVQFLTLLIPTGLINGSNVTFTLPTTPTSYVGVYQNGLLIRNGIDYTLAGSIITLTTAPATNDTLQVLYDANLGTSPFTYEVPATAIDNINTKFTMSGYPSNEIALVHYNGLMITGIYPRVLINVEKKTIIFPTPPQIGDTLQLSYFAGSPIGPGKELLIRYNFQNEKAKITYDLIGGRLIMNKFEYFGKEVWPVRPL